MAKKQSTPYRIPASTPATKTPKAPAQTLEGDRYPKKVPAHGAKPWHTTKG